MPTDRHSVFISSTAIDLPNHRRQVAEACRRMGYDPVGMEEWPAQDADAETVCLHQVDAADLFIGIYAFRYGWIPPGHETSITELEYDRAKEKGKPRLLFFMDENQPVAPKLIDRGESGAKLEAFKKRVGSERVGNFFTTDKDLRGLVIHALSERDKAASAPREPLPPAIPAAPEPYVAHPYALMQSRRLVGRERELELLTDWVAAPDSKVHQNPMLSFIAIGGMGKSALTWHFFERIAEQEMRPLAGRMWWSFYERDAHFESFVAHALAYCAGLSLEEVRELDLPTQTDRLWQALNSAPYLLVLDGLERILVAYNRLDAPRMLDDELDEQTANHIADAHGLPPGAGETYLARHRLRACTDPRAGRFLQALIRLTNSRILVSSRLYPAELQTRTAQPLPGSAVHLQQGLTTGDALTLWRELGVSGARDDLLPVFDSCNHHPLLIQALAGEVAGHRPAPGNFAAWRRAHPGFDPTTAGLDLRQRQSHILAHALTGLEDRARQALHTLAGLRMAGGYDTLRQLLVGPDGPCPDEAALDRVLDELEDRGLLGWERRSNRYDLHPIVRGVVWGGLGSEERKGVLEGLQAHFAAQPMVDDWKEVESLADLEPAIELYDKLVGLGRFQQAYELFRDRIDKATLWRLSAARRRLELLRALFPPTAEGDGQALPRLERTRAQSRTLNALAAAYLLSGQPGAALGPFRQKISIDEMEGDKGNLAVGLNNLSYSQRLTGTLRGAERSARQALLLSRELENGFKGAMSLWRLGYALITCGNPLAANQSLGGATRFFQQQSNKQREGETTAAHSELTLYQGRINCALEFADSAWQLAAVHCHERDFIRAARLQGTAALYLNDLERATERLHHALQRARAVDLAEEELPTLTALAELHRRKGEPETARDLLDQVWDPAERGPYPLFHADALNVLAQLERDAGNTAAAIAAATRAFELAWCDGPPYAYHWGLEAARTHLRELDAPEPDLPPFDPAAHEPMPEVEIDPDQTQEDHP